MKKFLVVGFAACMLFWVGTAWATSITGEELPGSIYPSTNEINYNDGNSPQLPYVILLDCGTDFIKLEFVNPTSITVGDFIFNWRVDNENDAVFSNSVSLGALESSAVTFSANSFVDVQLTRGPESDYFFDWTRFECAPIPEPGTLLLLGSGLAGIGVVTWRRRRNV